MPAFTIQKKMLLTVAIILLEKNILIDMTLQQLIDKATSIGGQVTSAEIPVIYNGVSDNLTSLELSQDNNGNYYVNIR